ncbi:MAG: ABC transporter substrate-binding protein [Desulfobulbaceae bacterium]|uniref:ABC transporter substrate-binding protein n=1 Tax=Candidatus Desulfobia pelagia TaxID=2841692 RepID=A0A8J6NCS3_9BACT|nr:ABC transporter substrate-binding protein [Candidatus Desulfobia pelagia]
MAGASSKFTRRKFVQLGGAALTSLSLTSGFPNIVSAKPKSIVRIGVFSPSHCSSPMLYADLAGYYKEHGLQVEIIFSPSMSKLARGIITGDLHFGQLMVPMTIAAHTGSGPFAKENTPLVSPLWAGTNGGAMVVRNDSSIRLPGDLKGKRIGIHSRYLFHYLIIIELFERYGINPSKDVTLKIIDIENMVKALEDDEIDAFINPEPISSAAVSRGQGRDFLLTKDLWFRHPCCCLASKRSLFENDPTLFRDVVTATLRSTLELNETSTRDLRLKMIWERIPQFQEFPFEVIQSAFTPGRSDFEPFPYQSSAKVVAQLLQKNGLMPTTFSAEKTVADIFLSDYTRKLMHSLRASSIPDSNIRAEWVVGRRYD